MKKHFPLFTILVLTIAFITACTKIVTTDIGGDLIPPIDGVNTKEMFVDVVSKNWKDTTVKVGLGTPNALGFVNDPLFGKTSASINLELKPPTFPVIFPVGKDSLFIDSVVLVLGYAGAWGDTMARLGLRVFEIKESDIADDLLRADTTYSTDYWLERGRELTDNNLPASIDITKLNDSIYPRKEAAINQLRIKLKNDYGNELLKNYDTSATGAYHDDTLFQQYFKGYQIAPAESNTGNALLRINLLDTNTKLAIYYRYTYRDSANGKQDTTVRYFKTNSSTTIKGTGSSNYIVRDRSGEVQKFVPKNGNANDSLLYIDANPGIYTKITIAGLDTLSNKIIHRAELVMEQVLGDVMNDKLFTAPNLFLTPFSTDSGHRFALPYDVQISNGAIINQYTYGCFPFNKIDPTTQRSINAYRFDMSRYVQSIITRHEKNYPLILYAPSNDYIYPAETAPFTIYTGSSAGPLNTPAIGRIRLGGGNNVNHKMRLRIVYSDIN